MSTEPRREYLGFGYNQGLPEQATVAWGCRAIVTQTGSVDIVHDRQSMIGSPEDKERLRAHLSKIGMAPWKNHASMLLSTYAMKTREAGEFVLFDDGTVRVVGNTNASGGYLYVAAFFTEESTS